jgi:hypothetical protein
MKLVNSKNIKQIVEDKADPGDLYDFLEDDLKSPCWEVRVDRDDGKLRFLIDSKELLNYPLSKLREVDLSMKSLTDLIQVLKLEDMKLLRVQLKEKSKSKKASR